MSSQRRDVGLYWDQAWKLSDGCTKVSSGCDNCWSETETAMRYHHPSPAIQSRSSQVLAQNDNKTAETGDHMRFDGRILLREDNLSLPLRTKKPTVFAVWNDLYHERVPDEFRDRAYATMAVCPQHVFLVLTKRAESLAMYWGSWSDAGGVTERIVDLAVDLHGRLPASQRSWILGALQHVWHGVTAENQFTANQRIPALLQVPGHRFVSLEPLIGSVSLAELGLDKIHAVLLGGESGKNARPMHPGWVRVVRDQCTNFGVPFYFKQWGEWAELTPENRDQTKQVVQMDMEGRTKEWSGTPFIDDLVGMIRHGKKKTGRRLDDRTHDNLPWSCR